MSDCGSCHSSSSGMSSTPYFSYSTPFKTSSRAVDVRISASLERSRIKRPETDPDFVNTYLLPWDSTPAIQDFVKNDSFSQGVLGKLHLLSNERQMYESLTALFNRIATAVSDEIGSDDNPIYFHLSPEIPPAGQSRQEDHSLAPDIVVLPSKPSSHRFTRTDGKGHLRIPWSTLESFVEVKYDKYDHRQVVDYMETFLQYRPDKVYALGMSCRQSSYRFYYADACIQRMSPEFSWTKGLTELTQFIYSLNHNYKRHVGRDESYTLHNIEWQQDINATPIWHVRFNTTTTEIQPFFARKGTGRRTWLGIGHGLGPSTADEATVHRRNIRIVKDMWRDDSRRFVEGIVLNKIHKEGFIAGVVRHISVGPVNGLTVADPTKDLRIKERVIMASTGLRLSACESVLEFLKVMYDLIETHEQVLKQGVLHRDISWYNVLCKPEHFTGDTKVVRHPTINKILGGCDEDPLCLLTDFDNACFTDDKNPSGVTERTGTPMFMACELSYGSRAYHMMPKVPNVIPDQFSLEGAVLAAYYNAYGEERYSQYQEWLQSILSTPAKDQLDPFATTNNLPHQPHHDMESVYWIILLFIIKAWPRGTEKADLGIGTKGCNEHDSVAAAILSRRSNHQAMPIVNILNNPEHMWEVVLHPSYQPLIGMLVNMGQYLCMRWSRFSDIPSTHSHEAFKRLLLKEIFRMTNENQPIPIQGPRPPLPKLTDALQPSTTNGSGIPVEADTGTSLQKLDGSEQSQQSQKRKNSTPISCDPSPKKQRLLTKAGRKEAAPEELPTEPDGATRGETASKENALLDKFTLNLANDAKWFM